jgi:hypothetical protein
MRIQAGTLRVYLIWSLLLASCMVVHAESKLTTDTGECGGEPTIRALVHKTPSLSSRVHSVSFYGSLEFSRSTEDARNHRCHIVYRLFACETNRQCHEIKQLPWNTDDGEIAGISLIGFSKNGSKMAADFWLAEGDGEQHRPIVYDLTTQAVTYHPLLDQIQRKIHGCDQNEDFLGVTNQGEAVFAVPPSDYADTPECGDKGLWHFNLLSGKAHLIAKVSGDTWK